MRGLGTGSPDAYARRPGVLSKVRRVELMEPDYIREQFERCAQDLSVVVVKYRSQWISETEYKSCYRSLEQALTEINKVLLGWENTN